MTDGIASSFPQPLVSIEGELFDPKLLRTDAMTTTRRTLVLGTCLALAGLIEVAGSPAEAQTRSRSYVPNTYADFPYNQGSLFYKPLGSNAATRRKPARRMVYAAPVRAPRTVYYYPTGYAYPAGTYYYQPAAPRPR
jgi:ABC-type transporter lipoprotein component MlaA